MVLSILFDIKLDDSKLSITKDGILFISQCPDIFLRGSILRVPVIQREIDPIYSPISVIHTLGGFASKNMEKVFKNINKTYNILYDLRVVIEPVFQMVYQYFSYFPSLVNINLFFSFMNLFILKNLLLL